jgi:DNA replication initiation complex subunit (GINS family)
MNLGTEGIENLIMISKTEEEKEFYFKLHNIIMGIGIKKVRDQEDKFYQNGEY